MCSSRGGCQQRHACQEIWTVDVYLMGTARYETWSDLNKGQLAARW